MDVYDDDRDVVATHELGAGDVILMVGGGHGFRMLEDTTLLEVKQGPYTGLRRRNDSHPLLTMIPVNEPRLGARELEYVTECVESGWISSAGASSTSSRRAGRPTAVAGTAIAVANGTVALAARRRRARPRAGRRGDHAELHDHLVRARGRLRGSDTGARRRGPGDVVHGRRRRSRTRSRRARGRSCRCTSTATRSTWTRARARRRHGLAIIEDAAEAHGAEYRTRDWRRCGSFGDVSCFSFYANKLVTTGEGGMVLTDDDELAERLRLLRNLCVPPGRRFHHEELGFNFRLTNLQAALGVAQVERIDEIVARKREIGRRYPGRPGRLAVSSSRARSSGREASTGWTASCSPKTWLDGADSRRLRAGGVETRPFFLGMHSQPALQTAGSSTVRHTRSRTASRAGPLPPLGARAHRRAARSGRATRSASCVSEIFGAEYAAAYDALYADKDYDASAT